MSRDLSPGVIEANHLVYVEACRRSGGRVESLGPFTVAVGTHPSPIIANVAFRDPGVAPSLRSEIDLTSLVERFASIGHGVSLLTTDGVDDDLTALARSRGWHEVIELPSMVTSTPVTVPDGVAATPSEWLDPRASLARFRSVLERGFADDEDQRGMIRAIFAEPRSIESPAVAVIAQVEGLDAAVGLTYRFGDIAIVGWVATLPSFRGRGLGSSVTAQLAERAFSDGAAMVGLEASPMGYSVYQRLGFERIGIDRIWLPPSS